MTERRDDESSQAEQAISEPAKRRRTFNQRMTTVAVVAGVLALLKLVTWFATNAPRNPNNAVIAPPAKTYVPPGVNFSGRNDPPNWGPVPNFPQRSTTSQ